MSLLMRTSMRSRSWLMMLALPVLVLGSALPAQAADIRDEAGLFSADAVKKAKATLEQVERDAKVQITLQTIDSLNGRSIDAAVPEHAKRLGVRGLFVLIAKKESKIEASASREYAKYFPVTRRQGIEQAFVGEFKNRQFDQGLTKGVEAIDRAVSQAKSEAGGSLAPVQAPVVARNNAPVQAPRAPAQPRGGFGMGSVVGIILLVLAGIVVLRVIGAIFGAGRGSYGPGGMGGMGGRPMGGPGYGGPGYGGGGGGGGFMSSLFGGIGGAMAGNWLYDQFSGRRHSQYDQTHYDPGAAPLPPDQPQGPDWTSDGGSDWSGGGGTGGSDWGTGGGGGGSDWGGGGGGGSDWGGSTGGGDWGGGSGGGGDGGGSW